MATASVKSLVLEIIGVDHASHAFEKVAHGMQKTEDRAKKLKIGAGIAMGALAVGAIEFGRKSVDKFQEVGGETLKLKRILGGTSQEVSRLRFAGEETGVTADKLSTGFGILSKHLTANDSAWKAFGVSAKDAHGKTKPMAELIPEIADKFSKMPDGPKKTATAMALFGKSGKDLLPFLNKGKDGLKELGDESDKLGNTLNDKDTAAVKKNIIAKRQLNAAVTGLQIQLGQHLVPAIASVVTWISKTVAWFSQLSPAMKTAVGVAAAVVGIVFLIVKATRAWIAVQGALNVVLDANPIGVIILAIAGLVIGLVIAYKKSSTFRSVVQGAFKGVVAAGKAMWGALKTAFRFIINAFLDLAGAIIHGAARAFGWVPGIGGKLKAAAKHFDSFAAHVRSKLAGIPAYKTITIDAKFKMSHGAHWSVYAEQVPGANAGGTDNWRGGLSWVGERGPELVDLPRGSKVHTAAASRGMTRQASAPVHIHLKEDSLYSGRYVVKALQEVERATGRPIQIHTT